MRKYPNAISPANQNSELFNGPASITHILFVIFPISCIKYTSRAHVRLFSCLFFCFVYHAIKQANDTAAMIATTLARATEAGPRASAPQQGRL